MSAHERAAIDSEQRDPSPPVAMVQSNGAGQLPYDALAGGVGGLVMLWAKRVGRPDVDE